MFKRLKRIEALLTELLAEERECLQIVRSRRIEMALYEAEARKPWKCPMPDCAVQAPHWHTIAMLPAASPASGDEKP